MKPESTVAAKSTPATSDRCLGPLWLLTIGLWLPILVLFFGIQPLPAQYVYTTNQGGIHIRLYEGNERNVVIPDTIDGLPVTRVEQASFLFQSLIESVTIPNTVDRIGISAFRSSSLGSVLIGTNVGSIGDRTFEGCTNLTSIVIPDSVTNLGSMVFLGCTNLSRVVLGRNVEMIGVGCFSNCWRLSEVILPEKISAIEDGAFSACWNLTNLYIGGQVTRFGAQAFAGCYNLQSLSIPPLLSALDVSTFDDCDSLRSFDVDARNELYLSINGQSTHPSGWRILLTHPAQYGGGTVTS